MKESVLCAVVGLGPIGAAVASVVAARPGLELVSVVEPDAARRSAFKVAGADLVRVASLEETPPVDVAILCTSSRLSALEPQVLSALSRGAHVVSTCEELAFPWIANGETAANLNKEARSRGSVVIGTGINPGFAMDALPALLSAAAGPVRSVVVHRRVAAGTRRGQLQTKIGAGLDVAEFKRRAALGQIGHVGLAESAALLAASVGWHVRSVDSEIEPVIAREAVRTEHVSVAPGDVAGLVQQCSVRVEGREVVQLLLEMSLLIPESQDTITLTTGDGPLTTVITGLHGDRATAYLTAAAAETVAELEPGLRTMADLVRLHGWVDDNRAAS
ncbi:MAG: hypothetical protein QOF11_1811 [Chloroflexota bacterium]|nr:hypothetical protein [Chloroflexota bacterium]